MTFHQGSEGATARLSRFVHATRYAELPPSTRHAARRTLVNIAGCCVGGARHEIVERACSALLPFGGAPTATLLGRTERTDPLNAAFINGLSSAAYSFDDTHSQTILHPSGAVAAALWAVSEQQPLSGEAWLLAFVLGIEVACRVSKAVAAAPAVGDIGWSQTGIAAGIGAAAAAARAMGLDAQQIGWTLGIASLESSGLRVSHGTMAATLIFGHAAQSGLRAALLAARGLDAPAAGLEGKYGFASMFASQAHLPYLTDSLGERFEVENLGFKPYPCGIVIHPAIDAALSWQAESGHHAAAISQIHLRLSPSALALAFRRHPAGVLEAKVSLCHWAAAALVFGRAGIAQGQLPCIEDDRVKRLRDLIEMESDATVSAEAAELTIHQGDRPAATVQVRQCKGSVLNPMSDADLAEKYRGQAELALPPVPAAQLLALCWRIDESTDSAAIARAARPG